MVIKVLTNGITIDTIVMNMDSIEKALIELKKSPSNVRYNDLCKICDDHFGEPRQQSSSHRVYKMPWRGDPRVNIQNDKGKAKSYQVRQVIKALERLKGADGNKNSNTK